MKTAKVLQRGLENTIAILFLAFVLLTLLQVVARYVFNRPFVWTEELARYLFVWTVMLGTGLGIQRGVHIGVDNFTSKLPRKAELAVAILNDLLIAGFVSFLMIKGLSLAESNMLVPSPAMRIPLVWAYASIPVGGLVMLLFVLGNVVSHLHAIRARG